jgi:hypothetical protein
LSYRLAIIETGLLFNLKRAFIELEDRGAGFAGEI